jgi:hypothetical protein
MQVTTVAAQVRRRMEILGLTPKSLSIRATLNETCVGDILRKIAEPADGTSSEIGRGAGMHGH